MNGQNPSVRDAKGRLLGLDVGSRTVGVAISDPLALTAQPLEVIRYRGWKEVEQRLEEIVRAYGVSRIVVGFPRRTDGRVGPEAERVQKLAARLGARLGVPYELWDERLTTAAAERILLAGDVSRRRRRAVIDQTAAAIMLQSYMDASRNRAGRADTAEPEPRADRKGAGETGDAVGDDGRAGDGQRESSDHGGAR